MVNLGIANNILITNRLNHRLWRWDRRRFDRYGVEKGYEKGSNLRATGWSEKERAYAKMEKTKPRHLVLSLPYRLHSQIQEEVDIWKIAKRDRWDFPWVMPSIWNRFGGRACPVRPHPHVPEYPTQIWGSSGGRAVERQVRHPDPPPLPWQR